MVVVKGVPGCVRAVARGVMLRMKAFADDLVSGDGGGTLGRHSPRWGIILELHLNCTGFSR